MRSRPRLRIAICGGGIGGLSLAVVLGKYCSDVEIDVYEVKPQFTEIGAGVSVWNRTWAIMQTLGLDEKLVKMAAQVPSKELSEKSDPGSEGFEFIQLVVPYSFVNLHRADVLKVLVEALPPPSMFHAHFNKRMVSYTAKSDSVLLHFADGTSGEADMLVGADGIKSATRATMYSALADKVQAGEDEKNKLRGFVNASWAGLYAYRALIPTEKLLAAVPGHQAATRMMFWCGKSKHVVSYPISQGRLVNIVPFVTAADAEGKPYDGPTVVDVSKQKLIDEYRGWEPELLQLLESADNVTKWAVSHVRDLPTYVDGLVTILGDAAHATTPHLGAGGGQAVEDAYILGKLLASPIATTSNLPSVLRIYDAVRRPYANHIVERSYTLGRLVEFIWAPDCIDVARARNGSKEELQIIGREIRKKWDIHWASVPDDDWKEAERMLRELSEVPGQVIARM
ncbi:FAD/NAD-binding domain-containing protein [Sanghuangporus baumii]|uniref:FAD/NAD-binding domain-containing protein n=1 Tax=Sanghuangporus baumii TaxID=108892 RepID=A0A9Q5HS97_SANBA|nr:FAD/NAD-binding domain-containing protein [Sanghuangporus baumii]